MPGNFFRKVVQQHKLGKVGQIEIRKGTQENTALVKMEDWNLPKTTSTRLKLQQGKPLLLSDNDNGLWKTYAYECKENELRARRREIDFMRKKEK